MVAVRMLLGARDVNYSLGGLFKAYDWRQERKAGRGEQVKRLRDYRRKAPRAREKEYFWAA